jgi:hypothetical protein
MRNYKFKPGDRVLVAGQAGEVMTCVPGSGEPWYFVQFQDGTEDRFQARDLRPY